MRKLFGLLAALCVATTMGCSGSTDSSQAKNAGGADKVVLVLNWYPEAEHGGYYAALVHGYYEEAGLDVEIQPGGPGTRVVAEVATGRANFGVANADRILTGCAQGADVVALLAPIQDSPRCIMVHEEAGIDTLADMRDVTLSMSTGQPFAQYLKANTKLAGVEVVPFNGGVTEFLRSKRHAQQAYSFSEPFTASEQNAKPKCLMLSSIGFNPYTSVLVGQGGSASDDEVTKKFVDASIRGWKKYLEDPAETHRHINSINPQMSLEVLDFGVSALKSLCGSDNVVMGSMSRQRWRTLAEQLLDLGVVKPGEVDVKKVLSSGTLLAD